MSLKDLENDQKFEEWFDLLQNPATALDALGRKNFARSLANALVRLPKERSVVTAVYGPWGCGKTWLLECIVKILDSEYTGKLIICRFSPWELKSNDQILADFFSCISKSIPAKEDTKKITELWAMLEQYAFIGSLGIQGLVSALQVSGSINANQEASAKAAQILLGSFGSLFSIAKKTSKNGQPKQQTLQEVKASLAQELTDNLSTSILVIIDDLDRLTDEEIQLMIRLLNTTANLPNLHYLVFGDRLQISSALNPICGNQGDRYLEKLVQNSFQLPEPGENQIRLRLWEGLEKIGNELQIDPILQGRRFAIFWENFLKFRITNFRDCHRLLRTFTFNANTLFRNNSLEVDFMDLLAVDFLRVFDPKIYHRIAIETPTVQWCLKNLAFKEKEEDAIKILDLIDCSSLDNRISCGVLTALFPHLSDYIKKYLEKNHLHLLRYHQTKDELPLSIRDQNRSHNYFRLDINSSDLPEAKVKEFLTSMNNGSNLTQLFDQFRNCGWLMQILSRLKSDPNLITSGSSAVNVLTALSNISDDLSFKNQFEDDELRASFELSKNLIERLHQFNHQRGILEIFQNATNVTLPLYLIELLRSKNGNIFYPGAGGPYNIIHLSKDEIERVSNKIAPLVKSRFWTENFIKIPYDASRAYRMAHALGPTRTERIFKNTFTEKENTKIWTLIEAVAVSMMPSIDLNSWNTPIETSGAGSALLDQLLQFASINFWNKFLKKVAPPVSKKFIDHIIPHLQNAVIQRLESKKKGF